MAKDLTTLKSQATTIANETAEGANTAARVGGAIGDIVDWLEENGGTGSSSGGGSLTSGSVTTDKIKDGAVTTSKVADNAITEGKLSTELQERLNNLSTGSGDIATGAVTTEKIKDAAVTGDKIALGTITQANLSTELSAKVGNLAPMGMQLLGFITSEDYAPMENEAGTAAWGFYFLFFEYFSESTITLTNFKTPNGTTLTIDKGSSDEAVLVYSHYVSGNTGFYASLPFKAGGSSSGSGTSGEIEDGSITTEKLADYAVETKKIANYNVTSLKIADYSVTSDKLAGSSVTSGKLADRAVSAEKIESYAIVSRCLADNSVSYSKLSTDLQEKIDSFTAGSGDGAVAAHTHNTTDLNLNSDGFYQFNNPINIRGTEEGTSSTNGSILTTAICSIIRKWSNDYLYFALSEGAWFDNTVYFEAGFTNASDLRLKNIEKEDAILPLDIISNAPILQYNYKSDKKALPHRGTSAQYWEEVTGNHFVRSIKHDDGVEYLSLETADLSVTIGLSLARHLVEAIKRIEELETKVTELESKLNNN